MARPACSLSGDLAEGAGRGVIVGENGKAILGVHEPGEAVLQVVAPPSRRQSLKAEQNLADRDGRGGERCVPGILQPGDDGLGRFGAHEFRKYVGIDDDHSEKSGGGRSVPRGGIAISIP